jgi:ADP-heptose:LPS heptosyltransferase/Flp pilus assembly protein TadD
MSTPPPPPPVQPAAPAPAQGAETAEQALARALNAAKLRRVNEAVGICRDVLAVSPELPGALGLLGGILGQEGKVDEAIQLLEAAIARQPAVANWHLNLCALYRGKNMLDEALRAGMEAVRYSPESSNHRVELALTHLSRGERSEAGKQFREGIAKEPEAAAPHMGLGELLLALGEYGPGWMEYAWRNKLDQARGTLPKMVAAPWNGMKLPGGKLLLVADQGYGDMIQFARYIPWVKQRVPELIIGWGPEVTALLGDHPDIDHCIAKWTDVPPHDAYVLLSTLPWIFNTELHTIPAPIPYLTPQPDQVARWRQRLDTRLKPGRLRVGIAWTGRPTHPNNVRRSIRLEVLAPVLANRDVDFVVLQKPFPEEDRAYAATHPNLLDISGALEHFADTGAVLAGIDLLIAVDTAVVHLAGAIGVPTWVLVPEPADWRWLIDREDSVWYPTLRLFRQKKPTEWAPVIANVAAALRERVAQGVVS